jgi:hypothetical protein
MNWLTGAGSIFSLFGNYYGDLGSITDAEAIASDWQAVGDDIRAAIESAGQEFGILKEMEQTEFGTLIDDRPITPTIQTNSTNWPNEEKPKPDRSN